MKRLIVLRPEPGASETVARARDLGMEAFALPLFAVEPVAWEAPDAASFDGLLLTSANAVRHAGEKLEQLRGLKAYCVGQATANAARQAGFDIASVGKAGVERLLGSIEADQHLLHLAGEDRTEQPSSRQKLTTLEVYRSKALPFSAELKKAEGAVVGIHSSRAATRFTEAADQLELRRDAIALAAISQGAADAASGGWAAVKWADSPDDSSLLALARSMCDNSNR